MDHVTLGRSGLLVSVAGLGCGGSSRLGQGRGASHAQSVALVRGALDLGINYFDTAADYGTEEIVGEALSGVGEAIVSSKTQIRDAHGALLDARGLAAAVAASSRKLRRETIDVFHLHGVRPEDYEYCAAELVPELDRLRAAGAIRASAASEAFASDTAHAMAVRAIADDAFDVLMIGFNLLNPTARDAVLPHARERAIGIEVMYAVRRALSHPEVLRAQLDEAIAAGALGADELTGDDPLGFLVHPGGAASLIEAAYRFCRHEPGCDVILTGTGSLEHLASNVAAIGAPALPEGDLARLEAIFGGCSYLSGN